MHIQRHPNGKYAKAVKTKKLALKPLVKRKPFSPTDQAEGDVEKNPPQPGNEEGGGDNFDDLPDGEAEDGKGDTKDGEPESEEKPDALEDKGNELRPDSPTPPRAHMAERYRQSLPDRLKRGVSAFFAALDGKEPLGEHADTPALSDAVRQGGAHGGVRAMNPKNKQAAHTMADTIKALTPIAKIAAITVLGVTGAVVSGGTLPALLGVFFVNRQLAMSSMSGDNYRSLSGDECDRLVHSFMDWVETLDADAIRNSVSMSSISGDQEAVVKVRRCPMQMYKPNPEECSRYVLVVGRTIRGYIQWDNKYGVADKAANGWFSVLIDGFNENAFRTGRNAATLEPYTTVRKNEIVLVNPARMPFEFAKQWAIATLRR